MVDWYLCKFINICYGRHMLIAQFAMNFDNYESDWNWQRIRWWRQTNTTILIFYLLGIYLKCCCHNALIHTGARPQSYSSRNQQRLYNDVIMGAIASQITSLTIVYSPVYSSRSQRKYQSSASLAFMRGIHRWPVNSPHKGPVTRKKFPFDDVIMVLSG